MAEKWIDCSSCDGTGLVYDDYIGRTIECHRCGGTGLFRNPNYKEENDDDSDGVGLEKDDSDSESTFGLFGTIGSVIGGIFSAD